MMVFFEFIDFEVEFSESGLANNRNHFNLIQYKIFVRNFGRHRVGKFIWLSQGTKNAW